MVVTVDHDAYSNVIFGDYRCDQALVILPAVLDPFAEEAAPAVMTWIALNWMIEGTSIEPILDAVAEGQLHPRILARSLRSGYVRCRLRLSALATRGIPEA